MLATGSSRVDDHRSMHDRWTADIGVERLVGGSGYWVRGAGGSVLEMAGSDTNVALDAPYRTRTDRFPMLVNKKKVWSVVTSYRKMLTKFGVMEVECQCLGGTLDPSVFAACQYRAL